MANNTNLSYPSAFCQQFFKDGKPLSSGKLYTYIAGSHTSVVTYKTISGGTESANMNTNPIILDMSGKANLVISKDTTYKFVLFDRNDVKVDEWDNITACGSEGGGSYEDIVVEGTTNEINVTPSVTQGVKRYVVSLSNSIKSAILSLTGLYNNVVNSLENKADKVQGATAGNIASLDANGNLTDSGYKVGDFKTKQTAVPDPSASGTGLEFISSVSQNANGEMTSSKKSVQDGTTAQKGVVKLNNAIDSSSTTEAATPKAVKDAYDALNNKIIARATFLSQAEWAVQSQLPGDPAKVYYVENGTGEDVYTVYVWKASTSTYEEVDESSISLDGYWHDSPTTTGDGNVVTSVTLGNNGVPQIVKGLTALTQHQDISGKLDKNGDASNTTSTFTIASSRTNISSGEKLSTLFGKIAKWFPDLKDVAFSGSYTDLSDKPTIPAAANNGVLTITQNGTSVGTFSANQSNNTEINLTDTILTTIEEIGPTAVDLDTLTASDGKIHYYYWSNSNKGNVINKPSDAVCTLKVIPCGAGSLGSYVMQIAYKRGTNNIYVRRRSDGSIAWSDWNCICMVQAQVGSTRLPIFANADGSLSPMNIDEYYCWAQPTTQWTDVMEMTVWNIQNQCNNEILGSVRNINITSSHPSLCYLRVNLPELQGAGRYRFTLEFEITNSSGILVDDAYGVLILVPPTGYSGEAFLAECVYDSSGKPQSSVMNQIHIPQQGQTTRHKLYVDGHTYRVVKTK